MACSLAQLAQLARKWQQYMAIKVGAANWGRCESEGCRSGQQECASSQGTLRAAARRKAS